MTNPSVFLSYSHDSEAHKAWVRKLVADLRAQGVDATLDQWDLRPGTMWWRSWRRGSEGPTGC
jgi:hypothetical protein